MAIIDRKHPRYAHEVVVIFHLPTEICEGRTRNISRGGLCANLANALPIGVNCDVSIVLMFDDNVHSEALRLPARVVWCTAIDDAHHIGVAFRPLEVALQEHLAVYMGYLENKGSEKQARSVPVDERFQ